jgi:hypothetical protein
MNREEITRMAQEAGFEWDLIDDDEGQIWYISADGLQRFAALVAAAEREACAKVCEEVAEAVTYQRNSQAAADKCAEAIRARGQA